MPTAPVPVSPLPRLLLLLSVTTGLVDAVSILGLEKVFTANMTGNIVFLGFAVAGTPGFTPAPYVVAIAAFLLGAIIAGRLGKLNSGRPLARWLIIAAFVEAGLLWSAGVVAIGYVPETVDPRLLVIVALTAVAMGFRNATIRQLKVPDLTTTVLTLTLTGLAVDSSLAGGVNPNWRHRVGGVVAIFVGAVIGAVLVLRTGLSVPLAVAGVLVLIGTLACARHLGAAEPAA